MLRLHDTATEATRELTASPTGEFGLYVCGPTVYGPPHIGHGRLALVFDVLRRYLEHRGIPVRHVSNVTDVDDKIIDRGLAEGRPWQDVAEEAEAEWWSAMGSLGVLTPHDVPHAVAYIDQMIDLVARLLDRGVAYATSDGVYLSVATVDGYGLLAHQGLETLRSGARVAPDAEKRSPLDFALWKAAKEGEPSWEAPFGAGRPGWHTECVVMSLALLGDGFSLHGGGYDLVFPHHENERAQAVALDRPFAQHWMHNGLVTAGGEKMSKSLGNYLTLADLLAEGDPRAYRLLVLRAKYRSPLEVTPELLDEAGRAVRRVDELARRIVGVTRSIGPSTNATSGDAERSPLLLSAELRGRFAAAMDDDLDTAAAVGLLFEGVRQSNSLFDSHDAPGGAGLGRCVLDAFSSVGLFPADPFDSAPDQAVLDLAVRRDAARAAGNYAAADAARSKIEALGWRAEDTASGTRLRR